MAKRKRTQRLTKLTQREQGRLPRAPLEIPGLPYVALLIAILAATLLQHIQLANRFSGYRNEMNTRIAVLERVASRSILNPIAYGIPQRVSRIIDGDTVALENGEQLRYLGVDAPELTIGQCYSLEAAERNRDLVTGQDITFYRDISERDQYGRILGYAYLPDGTFVNAKLIEEGYGFAYTYPPDVSQHVLLKGLEQEAKEGSRGLWAACAVTDENGRAQTASP